MLLMLVMRSGGRYGGFILIVRLMILGLFLVNGGLSDESG